MYFAGQALTFSKKLNFSLGIQIKTRRTFSIITSENILRQTIAMVFFINLDKMQAFPCSYYSKIQVAPSVPNLCMTLKKVVSL